jgi:TetR/AcrR family transcriptional regulator, regulator of cefoperazone and chloramphenicol sensitivity
MLMSDAATHETRQPLLEAAGEVFAERGFRAATVRDICQRAKANIGAVNYYFGDKEHLYTAVLRYAFSSGLQKDPPLLDLDSSASPEQRLRAYVRSFMLRGLGEGSPTWLGKLMDREMAEHTHALDMLIQEAFRPLFELLMSIVRELLGPRAQPAQVRLCSDSIIAQCLHYDHARPVLVRFDPELQFDLAIERWANHTAEFSLAALSALAQPVTGGDDALHRTEDVGRGSLQVPGHHHGPHLCFAPRHATSGDFRRPDDAHLWVYHRYRAGGYPGDGSQSPIRRRHQTATRHPAVPRP